ncbi:MAG TPA: N-formylglutamate amidohydrolase [Rhabdaerophilum sp.]|nr:N-formylglutamate amidohydrolase [Rhabdaerophilum sp.]
MSDSIASQDHPAYEIVGGATRSGLVILCDHAQAMIPLEYGDLGLPPAQLARHIAYDIGVETVSRTLAAALDAPAVMSRFSRLLIDPNRGRDDPTLVMRIADGALVPGNARIDEDEIRERIERFYIPYDSAIETTLAQVAATRVPIILAVHSFTPEMKGIARPWHATVIWDFDPRLNLALLRALEGEPDLIVGENEPYQGGYKGDTMDRHCLQHGYPHALVEIRQDLIANEIDAKAWGERLARLVRPLLDDPALRERAWFGAHPEPRTRRSAS